MLYLASDLHYGLDPKGDQATQKLARQICDNSSTKDTICLCGDIGSDAKTLDQALQLFNDFAGAKCAVLGNHDIWTFKGGDSSSWDALKLGNTQLEANGFHPLEDSPLQTEHLAIVGTMGWYDYSFRDAELDIPLSSYQAKQHPESEGVMWNDAKYAHWGMPDEQVTQYFVDKLQAQMAACPAVKEILVIMHHLPTKRLLVHPRWLVPKAYRFTNAFLGSDAFFNVLSNQTEVKNVFCGHAHMSRKTRINGQTYACIGGSYQNKQFLTLDSGRLRRVNINP